MINVERIVEDNTMTVTEAWIERGYKISEGMINLIVAPAGSGKTYLIFNYLIKKYNLKKLYIYVILQI